METVVFLISAVVILAGAIGVVASTNPVHSALMLVMTLFGVAVLFVAQEAHFLAAVQVIVYTGAIVVLFLFVIMLLGVDKAEALEAEPLGGQRPAAAVLAVAVVGLIALLAVRGAQVSVGAVERTGPLDGEGANVDKIGRALFTDYLFAFEATSALLVIAVVGAVVLARKPRSSEPDLDEDQSTTDDEVSGVVSVNDSWYLVLSALLFSIGGFGLLIRRNPLVMFMCVELMLNAVNLTFVTFSRMLNDVGGQVVVTFVLVVAAAEVVVGLGIIVAILRRQPGATADDISLLRG